MHILARPNIRYKSDNTAIAPRGDSKASLLIHFTQHTLVGALIGLALTPYPNPLVVAGVIGLFDTVQHQILAVALKIA